MTIESISTGNEIVQFLGESLEVLGFWDMVSGDLRKRLDIPDELFGSSRARRRPARA